METITLPKKTVRNPIVVALQKRHGGGVRVMKDRRAPKGGSRNKQRDYQEGKY